LIVFARRRLSLRERIIPRRRFPMLIHPQFNPVAVQIGPLAIHWYGLMYLLGFVLFLLLSRSMLGQISVKK